jgi:hypothetical protein
MAALGMTIICVIHQPRFSSFMLFDQVSEREQLSTCWKWAPLFSLPALFWLIDHGHTSRPVFH